MAGSLNQVSLIGHLGRDPEIRSFQNGGRVANLSLATSETWRDKGSGERKERTEWHRVVVLNDALVTVAERYLQKGARVFLQGGLETRKYQDRSGAERSATEVVLRPFNSQMVLLDGKPDAAGGPGEEDGDTPAGEAERQVPPAGRLPYHDDDGGDDLAS